MQESTDSGAPGQTAQVVAAWAQGHTAGPHEVDDARLLTYRHPAETRALICGLLLFAVILLGALFVSPVAVGLILLFFLFVPAIMAYQRARIIANAAEITPRQFAHLHAMVEDVRQRFRMPRTRVFVLQSPILNAFAMGVKEPYAVVLHSALIDALDELELKSVLGHEMGHVRFGHTRISPFIGSAHDSGLPFPFNLLALARNLVFLWWSRAAEMTSDRAGVVACGRLSKAVSAEVKLAVGPTLYQHTNIDDLASQADEMSHGWMRFWGWLGQAGATHPFMVYRIRALVEWGGGIEPGHDLRLRDPNAFSREIAVVPNPQRVAITPNNPMPAVPDVAQAAAAPAVTQPPSTPAQPSFSPAQASAATPSTPVAAAPAPVAQMQTAPPALVPPAVAAVETPAAIPSDQTAGTQIIATDSPTVVTNIPFIPTQLAVTLPPTAVLIATMHDMETLRVHLTGQEQVIGRGEGVDIRINHPSVSRRHFKIFWADECYRVEDLGSSNGTTVNDEPVTTRDLVDGDNVAAGGVTFRFQLD